MVDTAFSTDYKSIVERVGQFDPEGYGATRNFLEGGVSRLSPYISRGVISTRWVYEQLIERGFAPKKMYKFIQELAWRDFFQQVWLHKGEALHTDLLHNQSNIAHRLMPLGLERARTGIEAIDVGVNQLYDIGYMHNHMRMYVASLACNIAQSHWRTPARWMYYHLLDADWASNALSWQWVAGSFSRKKYFANQENINRFTGSAQRGTYLDVSYEEFPLGAIPSPLIKTIEPGLKACLPKPEPVQLDPLQPVLLYNFYNLDPAWKAHLHANRILLLEPSVFARYPVGEKVMDFVLKLSANIPDIQIMVAEFEELRSRVGEQKIFFREHPLNHHYQGIEEPRLWLCQAKRYHSSFFSFWKECEPLLVKHP